MATWPKDASEVREFMNSNCAAAEYPNQEGPPSEGDKYMLTAHDFLEAVRWWTMHDAPAKKVKRFPEKHMKELTKALRYQEKYTGCDFVVTEEEAEAIRAAIAYITALEAK